MTYDLLLQNGKVVDGTGIPWSVLDIAIKDGIIILMEKNLNVKANKTIDCSDLFVTPGFIDTHVHSDLLCTVPEIHQSKVKQGITTELLGQDGISSAPVNQKTKHLWRKQLKGLNGDIGEWPWESIEEYLDFLDNSDTLTNLAYLVPHGNIRTMVMGFEEREANKNEIKKMQDLVEKGMKQGSLGFSSGLVYPPNVYSNTTEIIEICKVIAKYDGFFVVHMRNESYRILEALDEMLQVATESGVRLHISHLKVIGIKNRHFYPEVLKKIHKAREEGIEITFDQYPYTAGSTVFHAILPPWMHDGGNQKMLDRLKDNTIRNRIKEEFQSNLSFENWVYNCGWTNIIIGTVETEKNKHFEGKTIDEISNILSKEPEDVAFDLLIEEEGNITMIVHWGLEEDIIKALKSPLNIIGSDGIFGSKPHPRLTGTYPRLLGRYVREQEELNWEEAIQHMTGSPAQLMRLKDRGLLKENYYADIVIFDPNNIIDMGTYNDPLKDPKGIHFVIVNGKIVIDNNNLSIERPGKILKSIH